MLQNPTGMENASHLKEGELGLACRTREPCMFPNVAKGESGCIDQMSPVNYILVIS